MSSLVKSRKVDVVEHLPDSISVAVGRDNSSKKVEPQLSRLFTSGSKTPQRKTINFKRMGDFNLTLFADNQEPPIAEYMIGNVASVIGKMRDNSTVIPPKVCTRTAYLRVGFSNAAAFPAAQNSHICSQEVRSPDMSDLDLDNVQP